MRLSATAFAGAHWPRWRQYYEYATRYGTLHQLTGAPVRDLKVYSREISIDYGFQEHLHESVAIVLREGIPPESVGAPPSNRTNVALYVLVRATKPDVAVETGVGSGISTSYILKALDRNGAGTLHSIDFPMRNPRGYVYKDGTRDPFALPPGKEPGWIIPSTLRDRWVLHMGKSEDVLPGILDELRPIDFFFHDSEHSYENMMFEFREAWKALDFSGILFSDDIHWNNAFRDFSRSVGRGPALLFYRGGIRK